MFSVVILTLNEAEHIGPCIDSLHWCDDIHVIDGGSTDNTATIATQKGANVHINRFLSFAKQRNWALEHCNLKYEWILHMDADERSTDSFHYAILKAVQESGPQTSGFYCCWKLLLNGQWLRFSDRFRQWQFRISRRSRACFIDYGDAQKDSQFQDDQLGYVEEPFLHLAFEKGWASWMERQNKYALLKAKERLNTPVDIKQIFTWNRAKRNRSIKIALSRNLFWPALRFVYLYILRLGFLDGKPGLVYCLERAHLEFIIQLIMKELQQKEVKDRQQVDIKKVEVTFTQKEPSAQALIR